METPVLQSHLPDDLREVAAAPLPRMQPLSGPWVTVDDAYAGQIALRLHLLDSRAPDVLQILPGAEPAVDELLEVTLEALAGHPNFEVAQDSVLCPDGRRAALDRARPMDTLAALVAEDLCILEKRGDQHVLTAALLCFPSGWTLSEKIGRPLDRIHEPVPPYDADIARRVQRFFDGVRPGRALWRANLHGYASPELYAPLRESDPKRRKPDDPPYLRSERQTVLRLPRTGAVLFAIHTTMVRTTP